MLSIHFIPVLELAVVNSSILDYCCHRKYSGRRTFAAMFLFGVVVFSVLSALSSPLSLRGDGRMCVIGFIFLIPINYLYKEPLPFLFIVMCTCWLYTLGIFSLSLQLAALWASGSTWALLLVENVSFLVTFSLFAKWIIPKYQFLLGNSRYVARKWFQYLIVENCLSFLSLMVLNSVFVSGPASWPKAIVLALLLASTYVSYFIFYKITQDTIKMNQLEHTVSHDSLTGLGNRTQLWSRLYELLEENQTFSVLFMDLDRFKEVNDRYGHMVGDQYLKHFAQISSKILSGIGQVYRFGGDEFVAVCEGTIPEELHQRLRECREWKEGAPCPFNQVSTGILFCQPPHESVEQILQQVDRLMYQQKIEKNAEL